MRYSPSSSATPLCSVHVRSTSIQSIDPYFTVRYVRTDGACMYEYVGMYSVHPPIKIPYGGHPAPLGVFGDPSPSLIPPIPPPTTHIPRARYESYESYDAWDGREGGGVGGDGMCGHIVEGHSPVRTSMRAFTTHVPFMLVKPISGQCRSVHTDDTIRYDMILSVMYVLYVSQ